MRIAVNAVPLIQDTPADTGNVATEMIYRLCRLHPDATFLLITDRPWAPALPLPVNAEIIELKPYSRGRLGKYLWNRFQWKGMFRKYRVDRLLCIDAIMPAPPEMPAFLLLTRHTGLLHTAAASRYIRQFRRIAVYSEFMREQVGKRFGGLDKQIVMLRPGIAGLYQPLNWEEREEAKRDFADGMEYFIAVGSIQSGNNVIPLLKAFSMLKKRLRSGVKLVLAGALGPGGEEIEEALKTYKFREDVYWVKDPDESTLIRMIGGSYALVHAAGSDGLAVPVYAAQRCEVPGVVLYAGASPEAGKDAALNAVPGDVTDLSEKMSALYKDEMLRSRLLAHVTKVGSWDDAAGTLGQMITS